MFYYSYTTGCINIYDIVYKCTKIDELPVRIDNTA